MISFKCIKCGADVEVSDGERSVHEKMKEQFPKYEPPVYCKNCKKLLKKEINWNCNRCCAPVELSQSERSMHEKMKEQFPDYEPLLYCKKCEKLNKKENRKLASKVEWKGQINLIWKIPLVLFTIYLFLVSLGILKNSSDIISITQLHASIRLYINQISFLTLNIGIGYLTGLCISLIIDTSNLGEKSIDKSHIWVSEKSKTKIASATKRQVYEHYHGIGSWDRTQQLNKILIRIVGIILATCSGIIINQVIGNLKPISVILIASLSGALSHIITYYTIRTEIIQFDKSSSPDQVFNFPAFPGLALIKMIGLFLIYIIGVLITIYWIVNYILWLRNGMIIDQVKLHVYISSLAISIIIGSILFWRFIYQRGKIRKEIE